MRYEQVFARDKKNAAGAFIESILQAYGRHSVPSGTLLHSPARLDTCWASEHQTMDSFAFDNLHNPGHSNCVMIIYTPLEDARMHVAIHETELPN